MYNVGKSEGDVHVIMGGEPYRGPAKSKRNSKICMVKGNDYRPSVHPFNEWDYKIFNPKK